MFLSVNKSVILGSVIEKISKISSQEQKDLPKFLEPQNSVHIGIEIRANLGIPHL